MAVPLSTFISRPSGNSSMRHTEDDLIQNRGAWETNPVSNYTPVSIVLQVPVGIVTHIEVATCDTTKVRITTLGGIELLSRGSYGTYQGGGTFDSTKYVSTRVPVAHARIFYVHIMHTETSPMPIGIAILKFLGNPPIPAPSARFSGVVPPTPSSPAPTAMTEPLRM